MGEGATAASLTGINGSILIDDTAQHAGNFMAIQATNNQVAVLDVSDMTHDIEDAVDFTLSVGQTIWGNFQVVSLSSGAVLAYKR